MKYNWKWFVATVIAIVIIIASAIIGGLYLNSRYAEGYATGCEECFVKGFNQGLESWPSVMPEVNKEITDDEFNEYLLREVLENADSSNITINTSGGYSWGWVNIYWDNRPDIVISENYSYLYDLN